MKGRSLIGRTYLYYLADMVLCILFLMMMSNLLWLQIILSLGLIVGFSLMCYNEGGAAGERAVSIERMAEKRIAEGKNVDPETKAEFFDKKKAMKVIIAVALPFALLAVVNLIVSPNYPVIEQAAGAENADPFALDEAVIENTQTVDEPALQVLLRVVTRVVFSPLLPLYTLLDSKPAVLYALFIPFSFVMPVCSAVGYLQGPKIREKKIMDIARGKVKKKRGLLVGKQRGPRQQKPLV